MANERGAENPTPENTPPGSGNPSSQENQARNPLDPRQRLESLGQTPTRDPLEEQVIEQIDSLPPDQKRDVLRDMIRGLRNNPMEATPDQANQVHASPHRRQQFPGQVNSDDREEIEAAKQRALLNEAIKNTFLPPKAIDGETPEEYKLREDKAREEYNNAEVSRIRLESTQKRAIYLIETLSQAKSETEIHWIIEDTLRAGENDWVSPDTFQQACQAALTAIDTVFASNQASRRKFAELVRGRQTGFACEFYARFVNAGKLGENITNFFKEYYQAMLDLPGVSTMMDMIEDVDESEGNNLRGAYFRKLNFAKNQAKRAEWDKYYDLKELYDGDGKPKKDPAWGQWVVDKKFELYKKGKQDKRYFKSDYLEQFSDDGDEDLVKVLLVKSHQNNNDPVEAIKELHRVVFKEEYEGKEVPLPKGYEHLSADILEKLHSNEKFKNAVRILSQDEKAIRGALEETKVVLTQSTGTNLDRLIYELGRSVTLAQRIEHSFQFSTHWDNIKWKKKEDMTFEEYKLFKKALNEIGSSEEEYGKNTAGGQIILNPVVDWAIKSDPRYPGSNEEAKNKKREQIQKESDPHKKEILLKELENLSGKTRKVNLRIAAEKRAKLHKMKRQIKFMKDETDEEKAAKKAVQTQIDHLNVDYDVVAIDEMRNAKNHLFIIAWDKAYRNFYEKYWSLIDFEGSFSGDSSREARKAQFFGRTLEQSGEAEPGKRFMRRYADTGAKDIGKFFAFESGFDMVDKFQDVFNRVKRWSHVMQTGDKLRGTLMQMLNDPALLADPVKFTTEIKKNYRPHMSTDDAYDKEYYSDSDYFEASHHMENQLDYVTGQWAEAIIEYNKLHTWQQHAADLKQEVLVKNVASMVAHELITPHRASHILDNQFGPWPKRLIYDITHVMLKPEEGMWAIIKELIEESGKAFTQGFKAS